MKTGDLKDLLNTKQIKKGDEAMQKELLKKADISSKIISSEMKRNRKAHCEKCEFGQLNAGFSPYCGIFNEFTGQLQEPTKMKSTKNQNGDCKNYKPLNVKKMEKEQKEYDKGTLLLVLLTASIMIIAAAIAVICHFLTK